MSDIDYLGKTVRVFVGKKTLDGEESNIYALKVGGHFFYHPLTFYNGFEEMLKNTNHYRVNRRRVDLRILSGFNSLDKDELKLLRQRLVYKNLKNTNFKS